MSPSPTTTNTQALHEELSALNLPAQGTSMQNSCSPKQQTHHEVPAAAKEQTPRNLRWTDKDTQVYAPASGKTTGTEQHHHHQKEEEEENDKETNNNKSSSSHSSSGHSGDSAQVLASGETAASSSSSATAQAASGAAAETPVPKILLQSNGTPKEEEEQVEVVAETNGEGEKDPWRDLKQHQQHGGGGPDKGHRLQGHLQDVNVNVSVFAAGRGSSGEPCFFHEAEAEGGAEREEEQGRQPLVWEKTTVAAQGKQRSKSAAPQQQPPGALTLKSLSKLISLLSSPSLCHSFQTPLAQHTPLLMSVPPPPPPPPPPPSYTYQPQHAQRLLVCYFDSTVTALVCKG